MAAACQSSGSCLCVPGLVACIAVLLAGLAFCPPQLLEPAVMVGEPARTNLQTENTQPLDEASYTRSTLQFPCSGDECEAWFYQPKTSSRPPVVLMAHGMGGQKDFGLHKYAAVFASHGIAAFVFDYRGWGGSGGNPRHWLSARRHVADWRSAVAHVRGNMSDVVDASRLSLWGTSFAGGHVLVVASEPEIAPHITAIVTQVPNLDASVSVKASIATRGVPKSLRMLGAGLLDLLRGALGQEPIYLPLAGPHGSMAFMQMSPGELERYHAGHPSNPQGGWRNMARAVYSAEHAFFKTSPIKHVHKVQAPVLFMGAKKDTLCPMQVIERAVSLTPNAELYAVDCDHFELFSGKHLPALQQRQLEFLLQHSGIDASEMDEEEEVVPGGQEAAEEV